MAIVVNRTDMESVEYVCYSRDFQWLDNVAEYYLLPCSKRDCGAGTQCCYRYQALQARATPTASGESRLRVVSLISLIQTSSRARFISISAVARDVELQTGSTDVYWRGSCVTSGVVTIRIRTHMDTIRIKTANNDLSCIAWWVKRLEQCMPLWLHLCSGNETCQDWLVEWGFDSAVNWWVLIDFVFGPKLVDCMWQPVWQTTV